MTGNLLWPEYSAPADIATIEAVPLTARGLPASTYALLVRAATTWPDRTATTVLPEAARWREPEQRTFAGLLGDVHRYANLLHEIGVRRRNAVALISPNTADLVPATLAAQLAGIAAPLNGGLSREHLAQLLRRSAARVIVTAGPELSVATWETAHALAQDGQVDAVLVLRPTGATGPAPDLPNLPGVRVGYLAELAAGQDSSAFLGEPPRAEDLAALFPTGGTTGAPKLAAHTHAVEVADAWMLAANSLLEDHDTLFAALPLFHVNALVVTLLAPLFKGQTVVWAGPLGYRDLPLYGEFWKIVEHQRISTMSAVPTVYAVLAQCPVDADISSLRFAMVGAAPLPAAVRARFEAHTGVTLVEGYGLTEATCASARSFPDVPRPGSVGQRLPYQRMKTIRVREDGTWEDLPPGHTGVLAISGPTVFSGYVTGQDEHGHVLDGLGKLVDGWLDTGDLARLDADGFVYLAGRAKDLIIRGGHNIDPALIEDSLLTHPAVTAAGAVGRPDPHSGEVPVAYVTLAAGCAVSEQELCDWARHQVPETVAAPKTVTVLDALPLTDLGKPYKPALRADATRRELTEALAGLPGVLDVDAEVDDGSVIVVVRTSSDADEPAVKAVLDRYAIGWRLAGAS
ncbi:acyl-CoA synthetase [Amycolatopsis thermoflava]|uniref:Fatty-acyl-CoA synthase n=1 Tax=Amycolatopsis thermoflava TaxID=84480 RepID=A0A3N2H669_9PSEU|nr:acyl-CoA synthetase [Amycolatopsis thermoflava]ROS44414.1 fatty-acyl-CoA synthase [Amycolatopsis thermoflava]